MHRQPRLILGGCAGDNNTDNLANDVKQGSSRLNATYVRGVVVTAATLWLQLTRVLL